MVELEVDFKSNGIESAIVYTPFDQGLDLLVKNGYDFIDTQTNAQLRIQQGAKSNVSRSGNWVRGGIIYRPKEKNKLVRVSPIIASATDAIETHREGKEFYITPEQVEQTLANSIDFPQKNIKIPTKRFGQEELTVYVFGGEQQAQQYGAFLGESGIEAMCVWAYDKNINSQSRPFVRQLWFGWLDEGGMSHLVGDDDLDNDNGVRGVRKIKGFWN